MAILRSGTPVQAAHSTAASSQVATLPAGVPEGALTIVCACWATTGGWGATPAGWAVVPNSDQHASSPSCIAYYAFQTAAGLANPTITGPASASSSIAAFAYTGAAGFDADTAQHNASSATCAFSPAAPAGPADLAVIIGMNASGSSAGTFSAPTNSFSLWQATAGSRSGIADLQLAAPGSVGATQMTISAATTSAGIMLTLAQADADATPSRGGGGGLRPRNRFARSGFSGLDEEVVAPLIDEPLTPIGPRRLIAFRVRRSSGFDETLFVAPVTDELWTPPTPHFRGWRPRNLGIDEKPFVAPVTDADLAEPRVKYLSRFRLSRPGDEQQTLTAAVADEPAARAPVRLRGFRSYPSPALGRGEGEGILADDAASALPRRFKRLRTAIAAGDEPPIIAAADDATTAFSRRKAATLRPTGLKGRLSPWTRRGVGAGGEQFAQAVEDNATLRRVKLAAMRTAARPALADQPVIATLSDEVAGAPPRPWSRWRRWVRQVVEDLGILLPPPAPSFHFGATLDRAIIFNLASCDLARVFNAALNAPSIFGATLNPTALFAATLDPPLIFGATLG